MGKWTIKTWCLAMAFVFLLCPGFAGSGQGKQRPFDELGLTSKEQAWIRSHPVIRIGGPRYFPPFHFYDEQGNLKGICADYLFSIMDDLGIQLDIQRDLPWPTVLDKARSGEIDMIPCAARTADREAYLDFSTPYLSFPLVIISQKDSPFIGGIEDLHGKKLAVIQKNATTAWLERDGIQYEPVLVESPLKRIEAVSLGRVDAGIENLAAVSYMIQKYGLTNVKIAAPTPYGNYDIHMAVRKDLPELLGILNKMIARISPEQGMAIRNKWLSVRYEHGIRKTDIITWVSGVILFSALILVLVMLWARHLKKESLRREKLIVELEKALAEIKTLKGIVPICSNCKKIRDDKGYWKFLEAFIEEHSEASFSHGMCPECMDELYGEQKWYLKRKMAGKNPE